MVNELKEMGEKFILRAILVGFHLLKDVVTELCVGERCETLPVAVGHQKTLWSFHEVLIIELLLLAFLLFAG